MDSQEQQQTQTVSVSNPYLLRLKCFLCQALNPNINDENNNLKKDNNINEKPFNPISKLPLYTCPECEAKIRLDDKETGSTSTVTSQEEFEEESDRMIIVPDTSSEENDDEYWCQSCTNDEHDSNSRQLWDDLSHIIKCVYRATDKQFSDNQFSDDISKAKEYVKKLTELHPQSLFNKLESIVFEYVREIRNQVLERFHTCSKTSHDVQLFISFLLDEYQMFIQAAMNVSKILSYLEENYMKSFHLTWLLYNKHLYEKLIYMDRKIQHSMSTMIDLLQPSNEDENDYSPAEYTQLLNRFLAFDEEMSEIACLYKDSQAKTISQPLPLSNQKDYQFDNTIKQIKKKKKSKKLKHSKKSSQENPPTSAVDISSSTPVSAQQGSNGSSIGSGNGGDESSSVSSFDDYLLDNETSSSGYTQEEQEELTRLILEEDLNEHLNQQLLKEILESVSPLAGIQHQINLDEGEKWIGGIIQGIQSQGEKITTNKEETANAIKSSELSTKKSSSSKSKSSHRRKEASAHPTTTTSSTSQIPKKSIPADLFLPRSIADLSAKIQSVSFTAGTFGSITSTNPHESSSSSSSSASSSSSNGSTTTLTAAKTTTSTGQTRLSINLTRKPGSKPEHGGQKIAEALFNELTSLENGECLNNGRKKDNQQFKKTKQQRSTINETFLNSSTNPHSFFNPSNKSDSSSSSNALNNLDHLLRHAASNSDVSEAALHSILSSFHSSTYHDSSSKTSEKLQALLAQQQQQHFHHHQQQQQKKDLIPNNNKHCEFCCCEFSEGRTCSTSTCLHLSSNTTNGPMTSCVTCMALPGSSTTTTSVMGTTITGAFNQRDVEMKERLKLKLTKRNVQNINEQQISKKDQEKKKTSTLKKPATQNNSKTKEIVLNDKNDIDDLVRFIDGNESVTSNHNEHQSSTINNNNNNESISKKNKKKKEKQTKNNQINEDVKRNSLQNKEQINQKKPNESNNNQPTTNSEQSSRSVSSLSSSSSMKTPPVQSQQQPLSKRQQKAKLKLEQQQKQTTNNLDESSTTLNKTNDSTAVSSAHMASSSSQGTSITRTSVDFPSENFDSPEEEVNWITISRKQGKHKPTPPSVPSLLAAPIPPVVVVPPPTNTKQHRQQQATANSKKTATTNGSSVAQQKVLPSTTVISNVTSETIATNNKQHATVAPPRLQNVLKNHASHQSQKVDLSVPSQSAVQPSLNLWTNNNVHEHTPVIPPVASSSVLSSSTLLATAPSYIPTHTPPPLSSSLVTPVPIGGASSIPSSSNYWDPNGFLVSSSSSSSSPQSTIIPSTIPGPVQRPNSSFSPAPGTVNNTTTSRCIQRPSPEPRSCSTTSIPFPLYSPMNYAVGSSTSAWNDTPVTNTHESQWNYPQEQQLGSSATTPDFPLYDPFHSGAGLTMPSTTQIPLLTNGYSEHFEDLCAVPQHNDINEMDALDKEIEDFKKFCFENAPLETREKVQVNVDRCFVRQT